MKKWHVPDTTTRSQLTGRKQLRSPKPHSMQVYISLKFREGVALSASSVHKSIYPKRQDIEDNSNEIANRLETSSTYKIDRNNIFHHI